MCALCQAMPILLHLLDVLLVLKVSSGSGALHKLMLESTLSMMSMGKSPQNGTERVSVTSAKTFFSP